MNLYEVKSLAKVDTTKYKEGDFFITKQSIAMIHNGKLEPLVKQSDLRKNIREEMKKVKTDE